MTKTIEDLRQFAINAIDRAKTQLVESKNIHPYVLLLDALDGSPETLISMDPEIMNNSHQKGQFGDYVRSIVDKHGFFVAIFISDCYTPGFLEIEIARKLIAFRNAFNMNLFDACNYMGIPIFEEVKAWVQCVDQSIQFGVRYTRDQEGNVTDFSEMMEESVPPDALSGRMWFLSSRPTMEMPQ